MEKRPLRLAIANPRGFCAGVERAVLIVERALEKYGTPVYVRHEIVHNRYVVENLEKRGAVFVKELDEVPSGKPVVFSAHGVPKSVPEKAEERELFYLDATCPLVSKVHREAERHHANGHHILLIGHAGHPEVIGTMGQLPAGSITLIEDCADIDALPDYKPENLAFVTQTTLSVDDTAEMVSALQSKFPGIHGPKKEDICYATTNRQEAVKALIHDCELLLVVGAPNSSNSQRLAELARKYGKAGHLVERADRINWSWFDGVEKVGLTAGASAPEILVQEVIDAISARFHVEQSETITSVENISFKLPRELTAA
jgi:4-hydroxy-3-methylbut-2-enyl diphosphate reductase